jgi:hypothetical protein
MAETNYNNQGVVDYLLNRAVTNNLSYSRTTPRPLDKSSVLPNMSVAVAYAANMYEEDFCPYEGQIVSVLSSGDNAGGVYKLVKDGSIDPSGLYPDRGHFRLEQIIGKDTIDGDYAMRGSGEQTIDATWIIKNLLKFGEGAGIGSVNFIELFNKLYSERGKRGFSLYFDEESEHWKLDIDDLNVRGTWAVETIEANMARYLGGRVWLTVGGSIIVDHIEGDNVYYKNKDRFGNELRMLLEVGDWVICETFNEETPRKISAKVEAVGDGYVTLGSTAGLLAGDELIQLGSESEDPRRGYAICLDASVPSIEIYSGLTDTVLNTPLTTLSPIKENNTITGKFINEADGKDLGESMADMQNNLQAIRTQTDRSFVIWFGTIEERDALAEQWENEADGLSIHLQDIFYCNDVDSTLNGRGYRFVNDLIATQYYWKEITDSDTLLALEKASRAQDTADGKRRCFICGEGENPLPPYEAGDQWAQARGTWRDKDGKEYKWQDELLVSAASKAAGEQFDIKDWQPAVTDTTAAIKNLGNSITIFVQDKIDEVNGSIDETNRDLANNYATTVWTKDKIESIVGTDYMNDDGTVNESYRSMIEQTSDYASFLSQYIQKGEGGHIDIKEESGLVTSANYAMMFSTLVKDGEEYTASVKAIVEGTVPTIEIDAAKVVISGATSVNDILHVESDKVWIGLATEQSGEEEYISPNRIEFGTDGNASFTGTVNATGGTFENMQITGRIYSEPIPGNADGLHYFEVLSDGRLQVYDAIVHGDLTLKSLKLDGDIAFGKTKIYKDGHIEAVNVELTGKITATSGSFTGEVHATSGSFTGEINATSGSFTGEINAASGTIGELLIDSTGIKSITYNGKGGISIEPEGIGVGYENVYIHMRTSDMLDMVTGERETTAYIEIGEVSQDLSVSKQIILSTSYAYFSVPIKLNLPTNPSEVPIGALYRYGDELRIRYE